MGSALSGSLAPTDSQQGQSTPGYPLLALLAQAELTAKPSPSQREKLYKGGLKLLLHPQSGVAAPQTPLFNPFQITRER